MLTYFRQNKFLLIILVAATALRLSLLFYTFHGDVYNHIEWGTVALHHGLLGIYELPANFWHTSRINQPPLTIYMFLFIRFLYEQLDKLLWLLNNNISIFPSKFLWFYEANFYPVLLKIPDVIADILLGIVIYKFVLLYLNKKKALISAVAYLFNPITFYNSALWGQTDALVNFFGILSFYLLIKRKLFWALVALTTSLLFKASLSIFVPIFLVILIRSRYPIISIVKNILIIIVSIFLITLPFHNINDPLWFIRIYLNQVLLGTLGNITENAFNFWALFFGPTPRLVASTIIFGLKASYWGYTLFGISLFTTLVYFSKKMTAERFFISLIITGFTAFLFLTGMHERYLFPIFAPFTILLAFLPRLIYLYIAISFVHLTNLYYLWYVPRIEWYIQFLNQSTTIIGFIISLHLLLLLFIIGSLAYSRHSNTLLFKPE